MFRNVAAEFFEHVYVQAYCAEDWWMGNKDSRNGWFKGLSLLMMKNVREWIPGRRDIMLLMSVRLRHSQHLDLMCSILKKECCQWFNQMLWCPLPFPFFFFSLFLTLLSSQTQCKSALAIAMATESVIPAFAIASRDSTAWIALKVLSCF